MHSSFVSGLGRRLLAAILAIGITASNSESLAEQAPSEVSPATQPSTPTIRMGGPAPAFAGKMIQGDSVAGWESDKLYVIEFWATWCFPCRAAIPHLNALHAKYKDRGVIFVGQSVWEPKAEAIAPFLGKPETRMDYRVAVDHTEGEPSGSRGVMSRTWLEAAGVKGIPSTWMIRNGTVLWIGHPGDLDELKIDAALAGTFDIINAQRDLVAKDAKRQELAAIMQRYWDAVHDRDSAGVDAALTSLAAHLDGKPEMVRPLRVRSLVALGRTSEALEMSRQSIAASKPGTDGFGARLQAVQDLLLTNPQDPTFLADVQSLLDSIEPADEQNAARKALLLRLRAWICALRGDFASAVTMQEQVVVDLGESPLKPLEEFTLRNYRAGKPPQLMPAHSRDQKASTKPVKGS